MAAIESGAYSLATHAACTCATGPDHWPPSGVGGVNVSGGGVAVGSKNKKEAIRFLEFLTSAKSQETFGNVNHEYPVIIGNNKSELLKSWGSFKADDVNLSVLGAKNTEAVKLFDLAGWE